MNARHWASSQACEPCMCLPPASNRALSGSPCPRPLGPKPGRAGPSAAEHDPIPSDSALLDRGPDSALPGVQRRPRALDLEEDDLAQVLVAAVEAVEDEEVDRGSEETRVATVVLLLEFRQ